MQKELAESEDSNVRGAQLTAAAKHIHQTKHYQTKQTGNAQNGSDHTCHSSQGSPH